MGMAKASTYELLESLFNTGEFTKKEIDGMLKMSGGLHRLSRLSTIELIELMKLKKKTAKRIHSALELGRLALMESKSCETPLLNSHEVWEYLVPRIGWPEEEEFWVISLDIRQRPIDLTLIARGSSNEVNLSLNILFKSIIRTGAPRGICCHTHPSGDPTPSETDIALTDKIIEVANWLGISIVDHIILGQGRYVSLADKGYL